MEAFFLLLILAALFFGDFSGKDETNRILKQILEELKKR